MKSYFLKSHIYIESLAGELDTISSISTALKGNFQLETEDEDNNKEWSFTALGLYCQLCKYGNPKLKNWYSIIIRPIDVTSLGNSTADFRLDFHFKAILSNLGFKNVMTRTEFNTAFDKRNQ